MKKYSFLKRVGVIFGISVLYALLSIPNASAQTSSLHLCRVGDLTEPSVTDPTEAPAGIFIYPGAGARSAYIRNDGDGEGVINIVGFAEREDGTGYRCFLERRDRVTAAPEETFSSPAVLEVPEADGAIPYSNVCLDVVEFDSKPCVIGGRDNGNVAGAGGILSCYDASTDSWEISFAFLIQGGTSGLDPNRSGFLVAGEPFEHPTSGPSIVTVGAARDPLNFSDVDGFIVFRRGDGTTSYILSDLDGIENSSLDYFQDVKVGPDNSIYVSGTSGLTPGPDAVMVIKKYSPFAVEEWMASTNNGGTSSYEFGTAFFMHENEAGELRLIHAGAISNIPSLGQPGWIIQTWNADGELLWESYFPSSSDSASFAPSGITVLANGQYVVAGESADPETPDVPAYTLIKLDPLTGGILSTQFYDGPVDTTFGEGARAVTNLGNKVVATGYTWEPTITSSAPQSRYQNVAFNSGLEFIDDHTVQQTGRQIYASGRKMLRDDYYNRAWVFGGGSSASEGAYFWSRPYKVLSSCPVTPSPELANVFDSPNAPRPMLIDDSCIGMFCATPGPLPNNNGEQNFMSLPPAPFDAFIKHVSVTPDRAPLELTIRRIDESKEIVSPKIIIAVFDATNNELLERMEFDSGRTMLHGRLGIPDLPTGNLRVEVFVDLEKDGVPDLFGSASVSVTQKGIVTRSGMEFNEVPPEKVMPPSMPPLQQAHE